MLETIREYAVEQLDDAALALRHADHYLVLAERAAPHLRRGEAKLWFDRLEAEHDNLRAALDTFAETGAAELEQRLAGALWHFWQRRGHYAEGLRRLEHALDADDRPTEARAWALYGAAVLAGDKSRNVAAARLFFEQALALFDQLGDVHASARVRMNLALNAWQEGDVEGGRTLLEEAVRTFEQLGDEDYLAHSMWNLASVYSQLGDVERARAMHQEVARRARATGNAHLEGAALGELAEIALDEGRVEEALPLLKESTRIFVELVDPSEIGSSLSYFARALALTGRDGAAAQVFARAQATFDELGLHWFQRFNSRTRALILAQLDEAAYAQASARGRELTLDEAIELALESLD
jgi:tetratricopeptide (TPR) repeat protein